MFPPLVVRTAGQVAPIGLDKLLFGETAFAALSCPKFIKLVDAEYKQYTTFVELTQTL
jgi:hypothetical protein